VRRTRWFQEFKRPVVACRLLIRKAVDLRAEADRARFMAFGMDCRARDDLVRIDATDGSVAVTVERLDVTVEASDEIVGYQRVRQWWLFRGGESVAPWSDDTILD
jgi:hypothetical protein